VHTGVLVLRNPNTARIVRSELATSVRRTGAFRPACLAFAAEVGIVAVAVEPSLPLNNTSLLAPSVYNWHLQVGLQATLKITRPGCCRGLSTPT
jgi:hypothetical protein